MIATHFVDGLEILAALPPPRARKKRPLLFVHGAFAGAWMWADHFMPHFAAAGHPCYAVSLRGHGKSHGHEQIDWHSISNYVDDLATACDWVGTVAGDTAPVLVGHSMGGFVVQKFLERHQAPGAVLLCSVPPQGLAAAQFHLLLQRPQLFFDINNLMGGGYPDREVVRDSLFAGDVDDETLDDFRRHMQTESQRAILDMTMFNLPLLPMLPRPPMLVVGAGKDILVPAFLVQATAHTYGLPAHIFHDLGHAVTHERGWPQVAARLLGWLETLEAESEPVRP